jgi:hypothetical protein
MQRSTSHQPPVPPLAEAFLALGDDTAEAARTAPSLAIVLAALASILVLALSAPLAWATAAPASKPSDQPSATAASKAAIAAPDDDGGDAM